MKPCVIVGAPVKGFPGSKQFACEKCGGVAWLAPSGQRRKNAGMPVWCLACGLTYGTEFAVTRESLIEIANHQRRN